MFEWARRYARWLHLRWPAAAVERLPEIREDGSTNVPGVFVCGDLTGVPLLKFALDGGARLAERIASDPALRSDSTPGLVDLVIVGAGVSGVSAAIEARRRGLSYVLVEAAEPFATLADFPKRKPIYTYPLAMSPAGELQVTATVKEDLLAELRSQAQGHEITALAARAEGIARAGKSLLVRLDRGESLRARRVIVAIGQSGNFRRLGVPGESPERVIHRLHDPADHAGKRVLVVGGGDSAVETAIALALAGAEVILAHRGSQLSRPKQENLDRLERLRHGASAGKAIDLRLGTHVREIGGSEVTLESPRGTESIPNDAVFAMIGREPPLDFFRRSGLAIAGEMTRARRLSLGLFLLFCAWLYNWKSYGPAWTWWKERGWFPANLEGLLGAAGHTIASAAHDPSSWIGTLAISASGPSFYYTLAYSAAVVAFGMKRIARRRMPYVTAQTVTLMAVQVIPLFLLPELILPLLDRHGSLPSGLADALFPRVDYGHGREFWRAYGLILAWPLNVYNVFTPHPLPWWLAISVVQTLVLIPLGVYFFGKGAYCGWVCSCGALAETLGDTHRHKMPHGPKWNRLNLAGQGVLGIAIVGLALRIAGWILPSGNALDRIFEPYFKAPYQWGIDVFLAGVVGYGLYFWFSGRVWCRFFCPLAALMHVYARFSSFRILAEKKKCISCGQCTRVCHQGIDVMSFANKGAPMADPECVRCSACVQACPTGVLAFGRVNRRGDLIGIDTLEASPVRRTEGA